MDGKKYSAVLLAGAIVVIIVVSSRSERRDLVEYLKSL